MSEVHEAAVRQLAASFSKPVMQNDHRAMYVEAQVGVLLGCDWLAVGAAWGGWDFIHRTDKHKLEVKASAAKQTWKQTAPSKPCFDIKPRKGSYADGLEKNEFTELPGGPSRLADVYVFAWHPVFGADCDQRDERQWEYHVVLSKDLPAQQGTIRLPGLRKVSRVASHETLREVVESVRVRVR